eukprot:scaffold5476_cov37-Phaeocystis_antarctica.AAC.1
MGLQAGHIRLLDDGLLTTRYSLLTTHHSLLTSPAPLGRSGAAGRRCAAAAAGWEPSSRRTFRPSALAHGAHVASLVDGRLGKGWGWGEGEGWGWGLGPRRRGGACLGAVCEEAEDLEEWRGREGEFLRAQVARADDEPG